MSAASIDMDMMRAEIPELMQNTSRWLVWRSVKGSGPKPRKVPFYCNGQPRKGTLDSAADWSRLTGFAHALASLETGRYSGLGFALGPDGSGHAWQGIDLDHISERPELGALGERLPGYVERSPSGNGLHAIGYGLPFQSLGSNATGIEAYAGGRYFTVTGEGVGGDIEDISAFVVTVLAPKHGVANQKPATTPACGDSPLQVSADQLGDLRSALYHLRADDRDVWVRMGMALKTVGDAGRGLWLDWSSTSEKFDPKDASRVWESFRGEGVTYKAVFAEAAAAGWVNPKSKVVQINHARKERKRDEAPGKIIREAHDDWRDGLISKVDATGEDVYPCRAHNLILILENAPEFEGRIKFNEFSGQVAIDGVDVDEVGPLTIRAQLERNWIQEKFRTADVVESMLAVAKRSSFHPVREWLESLKWDGVQRIESFFHEHLGVADTAYHRGVGTALFISSVLRIFKPGCKVDTMTILEGAQGLGKTKLWSALFDPWYAEITDSLNSKDFFIGLSGIWCADFGELDQFNKTESTRIKQVLSSQSDNYRGLWKGAHQKHPRQSVFVGGTNADNWQTDPTGGRRFLPVRVQQSIDVDAVRDVREQLWAEAVFKMKVDPGRWWEIPGAEDEQEDSYVGDTWEEIIAHWIMERGRISVTIADVLTEALHIEPGKHTRADQTRAGSALRRLRWSGKKEPVNGARVKVYRLARKTPAFRPGM